MIKDWHKITIGKDNTIREAMLLLDSHALRIVIVLNSENKLLGTVTDGDIRRGLLKGLTLESCVFEIMNNEPHYLSEGDSQAKANQLLRHAGLLMAPVLNTDGIVVGVFRAEDARVANHIEEPVVIMAGGYGKRLLPLTKKTPKPMLEVGGKPILAHTIEELLSQGFTNFYITTHFKNDVIEDYFTPSRYPSCKIQFIYEKQPLGTAGGVSLLKDKISTDFILVNGDVVLKANLVELLEHHKTHKYDCSVSVKRHDHMVPFGVVSIDGNQITNIHEKPIYKYFYNAAIYCFNDSVFEVLRKDVRIDAPALINKMLNRKMKVGAFFLYEDWLDIGSHEDYKKAGDFL